MAQRYLSGSTDPALVAHLNNFHKILAPPLIVHADGPDHAVSTGAVVEIVDWPSTGSPPSTPGQAQDFLGKAKNFLNEHFGLHDGLGSYGVGVFSHKALDNVHTITSSGQNWTTTKAALLAAARALMNEVCEDYVLHITDNGGNFHSTDDTVNVLGQNVATLTEAQFTEKAGVERTNLFRALWNDHVIKQGGTHSAAHNAALLVSPYATYDDTAGANWALWLPLLIEIKTNCNLHFPNGVHNAADGRTISAAVPTLPGDTFTLVDEMLTDFPLHNADLTYHHTADVTNVPSMAAPITTLADLVTAAQQLWTTIYGHIYTAPASRAARLYP